MVRQSEGFMLLALKRINLALRGLMELGIVLAIGYWGYRTGEGTLSRGLLGFGAPLLVFGLWALVDFRGSGALAEPLRLGQELALSGVAAVALYAAGQHALGWTMGGLSILHHALVYLLGERLLKH